MTDARTDEIAREAARLIDAGRAGSVGEAIRAAADALGYHDAAYPGHGRVRKHAQARAMQALGSEGYAESVGAVWRAAERLMTALAEGVPDAEPLLVGRAARGQIDGGVTVHVRLYTDVPIGRIAQTLVDFGYDEPGFRTGRTRLGRVDQMILDDDGLELVVTRCPPRMVPRDAADLFTGKPVATATLKQVREKTPGVIFPPRKNDPRGR